jgi:hypothetical protein
MFNIIYRQVVGKIAPEPGTVIKLQNKVKYKRSKTSNQSEV